jgi:hypothetical protein
MEIEELWWNFNVVPGAKTSGPLDRQDKVSGDRTSAGDYAGV